MIHINKDTTNTIYLTLKDVGYSYSTYTFCVLNLSTKISQSIEIVDVAASESKYSKFLISEPTDISLSSGSYSYQVFFGNDMVESGLLNVSGATTEVAQFNYNQTYAEFRGNS